MTSRHVPCCHDIATCRHGDHSPNGQWKYNIPVISCAFTQNIHEDTWCTNTSCSINILSYMLLIFKTNIKSIKNTCASGNLGKKIEARACNQVFLN